MLPANPIQLATKTWQICLALLPSDIASNLVIAPGDPALFRKNGGDIDIVRLRILPKSKMPVRFWSNARCFYELGVGMYHGSPLILGGVAFLQFSDQQVCGSGHYHHSVLQILKAAQQIRSQDFHVSETNGEGAKMPILARRYRANPNQKYFPVQLAAQDFSWLITQTLPNFQHLKSI